MAQQSLVREIGAVIAALLCAVSAPAADVQPRGRASRSSPLGSPGELGSRARPQSHHRPDPSSPLRQVCSVSLGQTGTGGLAYGTHGQFRCRTFCKGNGYRFLAREDSDERGIFQRSARFEASGILTGSEATIRARVKQKLAQTNPTGKSGLPAYVAVVEFGSPEARFLAKSSKVREQ